MKTIDIKYNILYYRKPYKLVDVDFKTPIEELYKSETIDDDKKKAIVNRLTGMLELKRNKNTNCEEDRKNKHRRPGELAQLIASPLSVSEI